SEPIKFWAIARNSGKCCVHSFAAFNIAAGRYPTHYSLFPTHCAMNLTFLGCGDAFGTGGRFNTCFHVSTAEGAFLIDCGASSLIAMRKFGVAPNDVRTIFISHLHGDHFGGLPFFLGEARFYSRRTGPLTIAGPPGLRERLNTTMEALYPGSTQREFKFAIDVREIETGRTHEINGVRVTPFEVAHSAGAPPYALRLECEGKIIADSGDS